VVASVAALALLAIVASASGAASKSGGSKRPTVVLVHGAWADASGYGKVIENLQAKGYPVIAPANPLRGAKTDSAYLRSVLKTIKGPIVLVGHSYGGFVITDAATGLKNVKALVYIDAFAPEKGETATEVEEINPGSMAGGPNLETRKAPGGVTDIYIAQKAFHEVFCADLSAKQSAVMAATQRPLAANAFVEPSSAPAWKTIPSWFEIGRQDHAIPPATLRFEAQRMGAHVLEVNASHVPMISQPGPTTKLIEEAADATI
jgi:pimeloyl-ACP methyl ester carboxylesterase